MLVLSQIQILHNLAKADLAIPRFASEAFALREIPNGLLNALEAEYKGMHFEEIPEEPVYSQEYDAMEVGGITTKAGPATIQR
jgi:hypothetical protein